MTPLYFCTKLALNLRLEVHGDKSEVVNQPKSRILAGISIIIKYNGLNPHLELKHQDFAEHSAHQS